MRKRGGTRGEGDRVDPLNARRGAEEEIGLVVVDAALGVADVFKQAGGPGLEVETSELVTRPRCARPR